MREYGQIQCSFWQRACEEGWSNDAMLLGTYLLTGPHSNGVGCYRLPGGYISDDLDWDAERVEQTLSELSEKGFCKRFGRVVFIPKFLRWNAISNANVAIARQKEFEAIPNDEAKKHAARAMLDFGNHWDNGFVKRLETLSKGLGKQEPNQPNPNQPESTQPERKRAPGGGAPAPKKPPAQKRGTRIPDNFPTDDDLIWATQEFPEVDHNQEAAKFRDYWLGAPGQKGMKLDWSATWRNWIRKAAERSGDGRPKGDPKRAEEVVGIYREELVPLLLDVIEITPARQASIAELSAKHLNDDAKWRQLFRCVAESSVLTGRKPWAGGEARAVDFDFVLKHAISIMEGKYDD
ncbi:MAG: hypothetical protein ACOC8P_00330 [Dichotomicrobium sp.]